MTLKYAVETLEGLDESLQSFYKETDNGFVLQVDGIVPETKYQELNQKLVDANEEAMRRRKAIEKWRELGESPDAVREILDAKGKPGKDHEEVIAQIKNQYESEVTTLRGEITNMRMGAAKSQFTAHLAEVGFHPEVIGDIAAGAMGRLNIDENGQVRILSADGKPLAGSGSDGYATLADLAKELAAAKPSFLTDKGVGGGGKPPASKGGDTAKTVTRSQFDGMSQYERSQFSKSGGKVVDG
jgi:DNA-binding transcriptional MerR regulator